MITEDVKQPLHSTDSDYRYRHFTTSLLFRDLRFRKGAAEPGDSLPPFQIVSTNGDSLESRDVFGDKPVLLIFGSMTCPMTASAMPSLQALYDEFNGQIDFIMLYVREAHPGEYFTQSETIEDKLENARTLKQFYDIRWTVAVDNINGDLHRALDPKPNAAFLMSNTGEILFRSLWAADRQALGQALAAAAAGRVLDTKQSQTLLGPVARAMGQVQEVMERAGPQAITELWWAGLPMALAGRIASFIPWFTPDQRGVAAVLIMAVVMLVAVGLVGTWALA
jgi:thiol-disulfide isomerase/thioredoxin